MKWRFLDESHRHSHALQIALLRKLLNYDSGALIDLEQRYPVLAMCQISDVFVLTGESCFLVLGMVTSPFDFWWRVIYTRCLFVEFRKSTLYPFCFIIFQTAVHKKPWGNGELVGFYEASREHSQRGFHENYSKTKAIESAFLCH